MKGKSNVIHIELPKRQVVGALATLLFSTFVGYLASETLTLTTTYPSPVGIYKSMITTGQTTLGKNGNNVILVPSSTNPNGMVGIGTPAPGTQLDVAGGIHPGISVGGTSVQAGQSCSAPEGTIAFDSRSASHQLVYCNSAAVWTPVQGGGATGSMCGSRVAGCPGPVYDSVNDFGFVSNSATCNGTPLTIVCSGGTATSGQVASVQGCPSGYTGLYLWTGWSSYSYNYIITCAHN